MELQVTDGEPEPSPAGTMGTQSHAGDRRTRNGRRIGLDGHYLDGQTQNKPEARPKTTHPRSQIHGSHLPPFDLLPMALIGKTQWEASKQVQRSAFWGPEKGSKLEVVEGEWRITGRPVLFDQGMGTNPKLALISPCSPWTLNPNHSFP